MENSHWWGRRRSGRGKGEWRVGGEEEKAGRKCRWSGRAGRLAVGLLKAMKRPGRATRRDIGSCQGAMVHVKDPFVRNCKLVHEYRSGHVLSLRATKYW